ncbi:MAG: hypothetical protein ACREH3_09090, partial [Geminicoccales bacterium]
LIGDRNGEIVLFNDSGVRSVALCTECAVVKGGQAGAHRTAAGCDVDGFRFLTFANGQTLYFERGLELVLHPGA